MHYNGVIFDFNGTLLFDDAYHVVAWDRIAMEVAGIVHAYRDDAEFRDIGILSLVVEIWCKHIHRLNMDIASGLCMRLIHVMADEHEVCLRFTAIMQRFVVSMSVTLSRPAILPQCIDH